MPDTFCQFSLIVFNTLSKMICDALTVTGHDLSFEEPDSAFGFGGEQLIHRLPDDGYAWGLDPIQMK